jgi:hypothetical protein
MNAWNISNLPDPCSLKGPLDMEFDYRRVLAALGIVALLFIGSVMVFRVYKAQKEHEDRVANVLDIGKRMSDANNDRVDQAIKWSRGSGPKPR